MRTEAEETMEVFSDLHGLQMQKTLMIQLGCCQNRTEICANNRQISTNTRFYCFNFLFNLTLCSDLPHLHQNIMRCATYVGL